MELAAAQLYASTNNPEHLSEAIYWGDLEHITPWMEADTARHYQWYPFINLGHYEIADKADSINRGKFISYLRKGISAIEKRGNKNGFYMGIPFIWCSNK